MPRATSFKKVVVCHTNDFPSNVNDKMKGWIEANGGTFAKELSEQVTHLVVSKQAWKRYHPLVRAARKMRTVRLVNYDWLEDSLLRKPVRALPEDKYLWEQTRLKSVTRTKKTKQDQGNDSINGNGATTTNLPKDQRIDLAGTEFDKAIAEFRKDLSTVGFHPYCDKTSFVYTITLLRYDIFKKQFEKYRLKVGSSPPVALLDIVPGVQTALCCYPAPGPFSASPNIPVKLSSKIKLSSCTRLAEPWAESLQLYESDATPHTYACFLQYTRPGSSKQVIVLAPPGSTWAFAWRMFEMRFKQKIGTTWNARATNGTEVSLAEDDNKDYFQYLAPRTGEPEGLRVIADGTTVSI